MERREREYKRGCSAFWGASDEFRKRLTEQRLQGKRMPARRAKSSDVVTKRRPGGFSGALGKEEGAGSEHLLYSRVWSSLIHDPGVSKKEAGRTSIFSESGPAQIRGTTAPRAGIKDFAVQKRTCFGSEREKKTGGRKKEEIPRNFLLRGWKLANPGAEKKRKKNRGHGEDSKKLMRTTQPLDIPWVYGVQSRAVARGKRWQKATPIKCQNQGKRRSASKPREVMTSFPEKGEMQAQSLQLKTLKNIPRRLLGE